MPFFGYIVSDSKNKDIDNEIIKVVNDVSECDINAPKLIVGLDNAKEYARENAFSFDILNHTYPNGDMWTFKKTEKREFYDEDIVNYKNMIIKRQLEGINYYFVNLFSLKYSKKKKLFNILENKENYIVIDGKMVYIALDFNNVIGISLGQFEYVGISADKVISLLKSFNNKIYYTSSKNMWKLKDWFNGSEYVISTILFKDKKK